MKNLWKWVLGIVLILIVVGAVAVIAFAWRNHVISVSSFRAMPFDRRWDNPIPRDFDGWRHSPMMGLRGDRFGLFGPFLLLGGLVKLAFLGALLYGAYWLGRRNARLVLAPSTPSVGQQVSSAVPGTGVEPEATPQSEGKT